MDYHNNATDNIEITMNEKRERKVDRIMKTEIIASGTDATTDIATIIMDNAYETLANAEAAVDAAEKELYIAMKKLEEKEEELAKTVKAKEIADNMKEEAQYTYDEAAAEDTAADKTISEIENILAKAKHDMKTAEEKKAAAENAANSAADAVKIAREKAEAAVNADIADAEQSAAEKLVAAEAALEAYEAAAEKYEQGTLGLIDWMMSKDGLSKDRKQDLTFAREVLVKASEESFSGWCGDNNTDLPIERGGKVIVIGDEKDATNLENLFKSIGIMEKINEFRATDDNYTDALQRNVAYTNFYLMATAEAGAMRGAGLLQHSSLSTSCENLAFNYSDPVVVWYHKEKAIFDRIKDELGIANITSMENIAMIEAEADNQGVNVRHYTNLFWAADQVMGIGYTQYHGTFCYNASKASNYTSDRYNRAMHLYTVEEFERLVQEYCQLVDKSAYKAVLEAAVIEQSEAETRLQNLLVNKDAFVEAAIQNAKGKLADKENDRDRAVRNLGEANEVLFSTVENLEKAIVRKNSVKQALQGTLDLLNKAIEDSIAADIDFAFAKKARDDAKQAVTDAETALKDAMADKESAAAVRGENIGPVFNKAEASGRVYSVDPSAIGDSSNVMVLLAELLASAGLMAVVFKAGKEAEEMKKR